jgi:TPR repeat protein
VGDSQASRDEAGETKNHNLDTEGGSLFTKSCPRAVHFYASAATTVVRHAESSGVFTSREPINLQVEASDGIEGRNSRRFYGTASNTIGMSRDDALAGGRANLLQRRSGFDDEVIKYYQYQAHNAETESGVAGAERDLGEIFYYGLRNVERNALQAYVHFSRAAKFGSRPAMGHLGDLYAKGIGVAAHASKAFYWFSRGAGEEDSGGEVHGESTGKTNGDGEGGRSVSGAAHRGLGIYYLFGVPLGLGHDAAHEAAHTNDNDNEASDTTTTAASGTHPREYNAYGRLRYVDLKRARKHLQLAANVGDSQALILLAKMRILGLLVRPDAKKAHYLFRSAARGRNLSAKRMLAYMSLAGVGTAPSCPSAVEQFKNVAERGPWRQLMDEAHAHYHAGNVKLALHTYTHLALMGYSVAQSNAAWVIEQQLVNAGKRMNTPTPLGYSYRAAQWLSSVVFGEEDPEGGPPPTEHVVDDKQKEDEKMPPLFTSEVHGERALHLYAQAAAQGHEWARLKMGDLLFYGLAGALPTLDPTTAAAAAAADSMMGLLPVSFSRFWSVFFFGAPPTARAILEDARVKEVSEEDEEHSQSSTTTTESTSEPDYERAKFHYTQAYTLSKKNSHVQSQARFALGWMYERGFPGAGMPRDVHLAKRMYDDAGSLSRDAKAPVQLALLRMRATEALLLIREFFRGWFGAVAADEKVTKVGEAAESKSKEKKKTRESTLIPKAKDAKGVSLWEGSMVRARWKGGSHYFTGYVHNINLDGTVSVQYDDGDFEIGVRAQYVERVAKRLHPIWIAKQEDSGAEYEDGSGQASGSAEADLKKKTKKKKKPDGIVSGSWLVRTFRSINYDVCAVVTVALFFMIFVTWMVLRLMPRPKRVFGVVCGIVLARAVYVVAIEGF